ncbi:hypothetical protein [Clostridium sp. B9]|uniref:hypothetical protein n=1 Tax=Clostridium sp. B9 TaxID=3423224 RepID=UPI003D2EECDA
MAKSNGKRFSYLLNSEILRDFKITLGTSIGLMIINIIWFIYESNKYIDSGALENLAENGMNGTILGFSEFYASKVGTQVVVTLILLGCFCLYCCYLWFGEFWGENKSSYTLLNLPISEKLIVLYKFLAALFFYVALVFFQLVAIVVNKFIFYTMFPKELVLKESLREVIINTQFILGHIIPRDYTYGILVFISIFALILVVFLFSLLERSFGILGGILGALIGGSLIFIYAIAPSILILYESERFLWMIGTSIIYIIVGWFGSTYLLKNKVHV